MANQENHQDRSSNPVYDYNSIEGCTLAIEANPADEYAYQCRGILYLDNEQNKEAIADLSQAIRLNPQNGTAYFYRSRAHLYVFRFVESIEDELKAFELNAEEVKKTKRSQIDLDHYASGYMQRKDYEKALYYYNLALEAGPDSDTVDVIYSNRAKLFNTIKEYDKALQDFNKVIELRPHCYYSYLGRCLFYFNRGEVGKAFQDYQKAAELDPEETMLWYHSAQIPLAFIN